MQRALTITNDVHIGVLRGAGTTPTTQWELRKTILSSFDTLSQSVHEDWMILGDLFDTGSVPMWDLLQTYSTLARWAAQNPNSILYLVAGNHDLNKSSNVLSSFQLLGTVLKSTFSNVEVIQKPTTTEHGYVIPHLANQDLFDQAMAAVPGCHVLFLHCNYDNNFAAQADQSLNLSADAAEACKATNIIIAHEHQTRKIGKIWIPGNQIVSSVSDCLGTDAKRFMRLAEGGAPEMLILQQVDTLLSRQDWHTLEVVDQPFVRVQGTAEASEAAAVVAAISRYRATSRSLVITNAVSVAGDSVAEAFASNLDSVKAFDVLATLKEILSAEEYAVVESVQ